MLNNRALIIPAAKLVGPDLQLTYGPVPPLLVPLRGKPLLQSLIEQYGAHVDLIFLLIDEGAQQVTIFYSSSLRPT